jgi:hypothetical protein
MSYNAFQIAKELNATALGESYHGNALYVARDIPCVTHNDVQCLNRWLNGTNSASDGWRLQKIAGEIVEWNKSKAITEYYKDRQNSGQATLTAVNP